jgi:hypothetical protein
MDPPTLDYRTPGTVDAQKLRGIQQWLTEREQFQQIKVMAMLAGAVILSFVGPFLAAAILVSIKARLRLDWTMGWWSFFMLGALFIIPIIYWTEWRTRGQFFLDEVRAQGTGSDISANGVFRTASYGEWEFRTTAATYAGMVEILLSAPRMFFAALHEHRARKALGQIDMLRAADVLALLIGLERGIAPELLLQPNEKLDDLAPVLRYLQLRGWIDIAKNGQRMWMLSDARARLGADH